MTPEIKDTLANGATITALGSALMAWETPLTILLIITGIVLNATRIYSFFKSNKNKL